MSVKEPAWSQARVTQALREKFPAPEYAFMAGVGNATGSRSREADGIAMSLWPSRGLDLYGFEIKSSRQDWINELKNPAKAEEICQYCDFWWIVTGANGIVRDGELPPTWGLMERNGRGLKIVVHAPRLNAVPLKRSFFASLMRRAMEQIDGYAVSEAERTKIQQEAMSAGISKGRESAEQEFRYATERSEKYKKEIDDFEKASGIKINSYDGGASLGELVRMAKRMDFAGITTSINSIKQHAEYVVERAERSLKVIEEQRNAVPLPEDSS